MTKPNLLFLLNEEPTRRLYKSCEAFYLLLNGHYLQWSLVCSQPTKLGIMTVDVRGGM